MLKRSVLCARNMMEMIQLPPCPSVWTRAATCDANVSRGKGSGTRLLGNSKSPTVRDRGGQSLLLAQIWRRSLPHHAVLLASSSVSATTPARSPMTNQGGGNGIASVASLALDRLDANSSVVGKADAQPTSFAPPVLDLKHNGEAVGRWKDEKRASATTGLSESPHPMAPKMDGTDGMQMTDSLRLASPALTSRESPSLVDISATGDVTVQYGISPGSPCQESTRSGPSRGGKAWHQGGMIDMTSCQLSLVPGLTDGTAAD